jgi:hypothetical protein
LGGDEVYRDYVAKETEQYDPDSIRMVVEGILLQKIEGKSLFSNKKGKKVIFTKSHRL